MRSLTTREQGLFTIVIVVGVACVAWRLGVSPWLSKADELKRAERELGNLLSLVTQAERLQHTESAYAAMFKPAESRESRLAKLQERAETTLSKAGAIVMVMAPDQPRTVEGFDVLSIRLETRSRLDSLVSALYSLEENGNLRVQRLEMEPLGVGNVIRSSIIVSQSFLSEASFDEGDS